MVQASFNSDSSSTEAFPTARNPRVGDHCASKSLAVKNRTLQISTHDVWLGDEASARAISDLGWLAAVAAAIVQHARVRGVGADVLERAGIAVVGVDALVRVSRLPCKPKILHCRIFRGKC